MRALTKVLPLSCFAALLFAVGASARRQDAAQLAATYFVGHKFGASTLTLGGDGRYTLESLDCTTVYSDSGTYTLSGGVLHFTILKSTARAHGGEAETNLLDPAERKKLYGGSAPEEIKTEFKLLPVAWSGRTYLIYESELKEFVNAVNFGIEPRSRPDSEPFYGAFYLREGDEQKSVSGPPSLPEEWLPFLLSRPVTATVVAVERKDKELFATVNAGSRQGLKVGMRLVAVGADPSPWRGTEVISVGEESAKLQVWGDVKVGDQLATKYEPRERYR